MFNVTTSTPKFIIFTWGCQMNEDDSEQIASLLMQMGYAPTDRAEEADIAMLVTCSVRAKPEQKAKSKLGELHVLKQENPGMIIGVCGCMAQRMGESVRKGRPFVDLVVGTGQISSIPDLIRQVIERRRSASALGLGRDVPLRVERVGEALKSFVPVMYGCDNYCAYCVVPYVRGRERSRPLNEIVLEIEDLARRGRKEVTLLGQNVNSYGAHCHSERSHSHSEPFGSAQDRLREESACPGAVHKQIPHPVRNDCGRAALDERVDFADLLRAVNEIDSIERIRFMTSHPKDLSDRLIEAMRDLEHVCEHIHLPIQSGDDEVLRRMNRKYTASHFRERVAALREEVPEIAVTTDFLVGFPGETDEQFENTVRLAEEMRFDAAFMFAFDPIPGTAAEKLDGQVSAKVKNTRLRRVIEVQNKITCEINNAQIGRVHEVLVEGISPKDPNRVTGLTRQNKTMNFPGGAELIGRLINVKVTEGHLYGFVGELA